jgi:hypothetical protein
MTALVTVVFAKLIVSPGARPTIAPWAARFSAAQSCLPLMRFGHFEPRQGAANPWRRFGTKRAMSRGQAPHATAPGASRAKRPGERAREDAAGPSREHTIGRHDRAGTVARASRFARRGRGACGKIEQRNGSPLIRAGLPRALRAVARHARGRRSGGAWAGRCCPIGPIGGGLGHALSDREAAQFLEAAQYTLVVLEAAQ